MKRLPIVFILLVLLTIGITLWWKHGTTPANARDMSEKIFVIKKGEPLRDIANNLRKEGLIKDPVVFFLLVKQQGKDNKIQAGDFRLSPSMKPADILETLTHGTLDIWITIPEGKRAEEIADILQKKIPGFTQEWRTTLNENEGYLFPDTYLIPKDAPIDLILTQLKNNFDNKYQQVPVNADASKEDIVKIASLIEREAKHAEDRPVVASVIYNRLKIGVALQVDATIQYALGYQPNEKNWWKRHLTASDLKLDSPYNSYLNPGLPPTPIANPGVLAMQAAANPATTNYLYYFTDKNGKTHFTKTNEEHNALIQKYGL